VAVPRGAGADALMAPLVAVGPAVGDGELPVLVVVADVLVLPVREERLSDVVTGPRRPHLDGVEDGLPRRPGRWGPDVAAHEGARVGRVRGAGRDGEGAEGEQRRGEHGERTGERRHGGLSSGGTDERDRPHVGDGRVVARARVVEPDADGAVRGRGRGLDDYLVRHRAGARVPALVDPLVDDLPVDGDGVVLELRTVV